MQGIGVPPIKGFSLLVIVIEWLTVVEKCEGCETSRREMGAVFCEQISRLLEAFKYILDMKSSGGTR